jgi:hypothetical protein
MQTNVRIVTENDLIFPDDNIHPWKLCVMSWKPLSVCIDESIQVFPTTVLSRIIAEYVTKEPFAFDKTRCWSHILYQHPIWFYQVTEMEDWIDVTPNKLICKSYSKPWIYVLSKNPIHAIEDEWWFEVSGDTFDRMYFGFAAVQSNGEFCRKALVSVYKCDRHEKMQYRVKKNSKELCISNHEDYCQCTITDAFGDVVKDDPKYMVLPIPEDTTNLYFYVTTGYESHVITVL